jgi:Septum formation
MSSQPTGDTQGSAVSASQADEGGAPQPEAAPAGAAVPAGAGVPAGATATAGTARSDAGAASGPAGPTGASAETADVAVADACATEHGTEPDAEHGAESGRREPVSKLAVVALITAVLALVPIAVACAIAALIGIRRTGRRGHGMAMAALFASATWVIMGSAVGTVAALTHGFKKPVTIKYHESAVFKLREGDCVNMTNGQLVTVLPCTIPHQAEVFATFALPASAWPGTAALKLDAGSGCASRLTGYINPQLAISLAQSYVYPNKVAWTAGTRTVICEVRAASGQLTGSVRGASSS